jgi:hypothetical protein
MQVRYTVIHESYSSKSKHISRFFPGGLSSLRRLRVVLTVCIRVRVASLSESSSAFGRLRWQNGMHRLMRCMHRVIDEKRKCRPANINTCCTVLYCTVHWRCKLPGFRMKQIIQSENRQYQRWALGVLCGARRPADNRGKCEALLTVYSLSCS